MDIDVSEAIESVRTELRDVEVRLSGRVDALSGRIDVVSGRIEALSGRIDGSELTLRGEMALMRVELRDEFRDGLAQNRRHAEVLIEAVRDDIRIVAEGVAALTAKVDALGGRSH